MRKIHTLTLITVLSLALSACGRSPSKTSDFSSDTDSGDQPIYVDEYADAKINIIQTNKLNEEFKVTYKTYEPEGTGEAMFKARSLKEIAQAGENAPSEGKKLVLVEISVKGNAKNKGYPSTFNQVGDRPSPQFVLIDKAKNKSYVETTYFSDAYTTEKKLFELSKITLDHEKLINTALVFEIDKNLTPNLAFRYVDGEGKTVFYELAL